MVCKALIPKCVLPHAFLYSPNPTQSNSGVRNQSVTRAEALQRAGAVAYDNVILGAIRCLVTVYDTDVRT